MQAARFPRNSAGKRSRCSRGLLRRGWQETVYQCRTYELQDTVRRSRAAGVRTGRKKCRAGGLCDLLIVPAQAISQRHAKSCRTYHAGWGRTQTPAGSVGAIVWFCIFGDYAALHPVRHGRRSRIPCGTRAPAETPHSRVEGQPGRGYGRGQTWGVDGIITKDPALALRVLWGGRRNSLRMDRAGAGTHRRTHSRKRRSHPG